MSVSLVWMYIHWIIEFIFLSVLLYSCELCSFVQVLNPGGWTWHKNYFLASFSWRLSDIENKFANLMDGNFPGSHPTGTAVRKIVHVGQPSGIINFPVVICLAVFPCRSTDGDYYPDGFPYFPVGFWPWGKDRFLVVRHAYANEFSQTGGQESLHGTSYRENSGHKNWNRIVHVSLVR
jgi:hypothetical protein